MKIPLILLVIAMASVAAATEPVDLGDPTPRAVEVWFESSPPDRPGQLDARYDWPVTGWLSPGAVPGHAVVRISAEEMERYLEGHDPVPGSVSDFVWEFEAETGQVVSAQFSARFQQPVELPFFTTHVQMDTRTRLTTAREVGFLPPVARFGHLIHEFCAADEPDCIAVAPRPYDFRTGYVNAVGWVDARALAGVEARSFSPMGEAIFREQPAEATTAVSLGPPSH